MWLFIYKWNAWFTSVTFKSLYVVVFLSAKNLAEFFTVGSLSLLQKSANHPVKLSKNKGTVSVILSHLLVKEGIHNGPIDLCLIKIDLRISTVAKHVWIIRTLIYLENRQYLPHFWSDQGFKGTVVNRAFSYLHGWSLAFYIWRLGVWIYVCLRIWGTSSAPAPLKKALE